MDTNDQAYLEQMMDDMDGMSFATTKGRANRKRKTSVVVKSLRKISSKTEGVRKDATVVIENTPETRLWQEWIAGFEMICTSFWQYFEREAVFFKKGVTSRKYFNRIRGT